MPVLEAVELYRFYHSALDETRALRGVSLALEAGEFVAVMGPSGCGKSTLLACLAGLDEPDGGFVTVANERMTRRPEAVRARLRAQKIGILLQSGNLFDHLSVIDNVRLQRRLSRVAGDVGVAALLQSLGLSERAGHLPAELSGGEAQRAGLAVALTADPSILLADEPTAEVDSETEADLVAYFLNRRNNGGVTLVVTHSDALARRADRVLQMHDGRIVHD